MARTRAAACALALALALAAPGGAQAFERIDATFLAEYSAPQYTIDQGEIVTFGNSDPFLTHGLVSDLGTGALFSAPPIAAGQVRLLRGAPFLTAAGSPYSFHCPIHPGMTAQLNVGPGGAPLPPDETAPATILKIKAVSAAKLARGRALRLILYPSEAVDVTLAAGVKGASLGRAERTYVTAARRVVKLKLSRSAARAVSRLGAAARVKVKLTLSDVAGNVTVVKASRRL